MFLRMLKLLDNQILIHSNKLRNFKLKNHKKGIIRSFLKKTYENKAKKFMRKQHKNFYKLKISITQIILSARNMNRLTKYLFPKIPIKTVNQIKSKFGK